MSRSWRPAAVATAVLLGLLIPAGTGTARAEDDAGKRVHARVVGTLEGESVAPAVNRHGDVAFTTKQGDQMVWNATTGERRTLQKVPDAAPSDLTDDGRVVGAHHTDGLILWAADGSVTRIGIPPGQVAVLYGSPRIGEDGTVLLTAYHLVRPDPRRPQPVYMSYRWTSGGGFQLLGAAGEGTTAMAVNDAGLIVGSSGNTAAAWHPDGSVETYAPTPGHTSRTWARGVSDRGVLVGGQQRPGSDGRATPTRWDGPAEPQELTDLGFGGEAAGVNSRGWITGTVHTSATDYRAVPVVWDPHGGPHRLDELLDVPEGGTLADVEAINDRDQLLVRMYTADRKPLDQVVQLH
ncbi:hypothetical protein [Streptomyces ehimensis]|uniref:Uncharacterized protein n=1 Tax=Streptomyces ehimensis TaxID=68195 RepID=A0ABV9BKZ6_9ACTN